jgi:hypothetical protein
MYSRLRHQVYAAAVPQHSSGVDEGRLRPLV